MWKRTLVASLMLVVVLSSGCKQRRVSGSVDKTTERSRQLSILAASEAANISDADARLTRQLNIADKVLTRFGKEDGITVLREVSRTLVATGGKLNSHARLSGWVSVS